jgi:CRISPR-associated protein Cas2
MSEAVRERVWEVLEDWFLQEDASSIVMVWQDSTSSFGQSVRVLGSPPITFVDANGIVLARRPLPKTEDPPKIGDYPSSKEV